MKPFVAAAALGMALCASTALGQGVPDIEKRLDAILAKAFEKNRFVGLSVAVIDKDNKNNSFKKHYGFRDHARTKAPDGDTMYEIASITKVFARLAVAAQDKVKPEDLLAQHLPKGVKVPKPHGQDITIRQLMDHVSSMPSLPCVFRPEDLKTPVCYGIDPNPSAKDPWAVGTKALGYEFVSAFAEMAEKLPDRVPKVGHYLEYSNTGTGLLGNLLADAHSQTFEQVVYNSILQPLGMDRTKIDMPCDKNGTCDNLAETHSLKLDGSGWEPWELWHMNGIPAAGAIRSSLNDMEKFLIANMTPEKSPLRAVLEKGQTDLPEVTKAHNANICAQGQEREKHFCNIRKMYYTYAWAAWRKQDRFYHNGGTYGSESRLEFSRDRKFGVVILANSTPFIASLGRSEPTRDLSVCIKELRANANDPMPLACRMLIEKSPIEN